MSTLRELTLIAAVLALAAVFGASLYQSVIDAPNFNSALPGSLEHFRLFMSVANPGDYFRKAAPAAQILVLVSLALAWTTGHSVRWWLLAALFCVVGGDVITFTIHYPRNAIMFTDPLTVPVDVLRKAASEWMFWNHVRTALVLLATVCTIKALLLNNRDSSVRP